MKNYKKVLAILLALTLSFSLVACSSNEEETANGENTTSASNETGDKTQVITGDEALKELEEVATQVEDMEALSYFDISLSATTLEGDEEIQIDMHMQADFSDEENPLLAMDISMPMMGNLAVYLKDGYSHAEVLGIKVKDKASFGDIYSSSNTFTNFTNFNDAKDLTLTISEDGSKTFDFYYESKSSINLDSLTGGFSDFSINDGDIVYSTVKTDENNTLLSINMYSVDAENSNTITANVDIIFNSLNTPFEIEFPDLSEYKEY